MDQHPQYLMSMKNKCLGDFYFHAPTQNMFNKSWEEQAFADDVAFIWPPRSYSCSFCKRKFRSAQALGGHMNVHRRDRARLRLSQTSQNEDTSPANINLSPNFGLNFLTLSNSPCNVSDLKDAERKEDCRSMGYDESNLSIGLNLVLSRTRPCGFECNEGISPKRLKTTVLSMPFFLKPSSNESHVQGLDLELRLGDAHQS